MRLPDVVGFEIGSCLGISGVTAHQALHARGAIRGRTVLVQGDVGGVGSFAVGLGQLAGARVIATVRSAADVDAAMQAGADAVVVAGQRHREEVVPDIRQLAPQGVDHIVEVAFDENIDLDEQVLAMGGSISAYAKREARPTMPFWNLLFKNTRIFLVGSDDFPFAAKRDAAQALNALVTHRRHADCCCRQHGRPGGRVAACVGRGPHRTHAGGVSRQRSRSGSPARCVSPASSLWQVLVVMQHRACNAASWLWFSLEFRPETRYVKPQSRNLIEL